MKGEQGSEQGCRGERGEGKGHQFSYYSLTK